MRDLLPLSYEALISHFPKRAWDCHKGDNGHVCLVGAGQLGYSGAVGLAAGGALHAGAGLVSAMVAPHSVPLLARAPLELMCHSSEDAADLVPLLDKASVVAVGPGLTQTHWAKNFFGQALTTERPLVLDADGLNLLSTMPQKRKNWILTPHPGEAARLLAVSIHEVQSDRFAALQALHQKYGGIIVLKGAGTLVFDGKTAFIQEGGIPALATGGTGDVLTGVIAALVAQGLSLLLAAKIGVSVHARAAEMEQLKGERGMLASDLFLPLRTLLNP